MKFAIFFMAVWVLSGIFFDYHRSKKDQQEIASLKLEIMQLKKFQSNLAAGFMSLHRQDEYVQEVMNESNEQ